MDGGNMTYPLPEPFIARIRRQLGDELPAFLEAMDKPAVRGIRFNPDKNCAVTEHLKSGEPVPWEKNGWYLTSGETPGSTIWHEAGAFYLQDPGAMIPVNILNPKPGEQILDLCAAPGGKSTQIGAAMNGEGLLVCNEPVPKRAQILSRNLERMGIRNSVAVCAMPEQLSARWKERFDAVLVDAPCSGEGMFRREPESRNEWSPEKASGCAARQRAILKEAACMVRPGGRIVYSTCTYNPAENEENVEWFLREHPGWEKELFEINGIHCSDGHVTCWPHLSRGEGQFAALLRRKEGKRGPVRDELSLPPARHDEKNTIRTLFPYFPEATNRLGNTLVHLAQYPDLSGIKVIHAGIHLGEIHGSIFVPDHAAAIALRPIHTEDVAESDAVRYMAGEQIEGDTKGWTVVSCRRIPLGWGKGSNGVIKNHYPKGLRNSRLTV